MEEGTVKSFIEEKGVIKGVIYKNNVSQEATAFAPLTVVCDGCYSNLRRSLVDSSVSIYIVIFEVEYIELLNLLHEIQLKINYLWFLNLRSYIFIGESAHIHGGLHYEE